MKSRLESAMTENGVTKDDVKYVLRAMLNEKYYDDELVNGIVKELIESDNSIHSYCTDVVMALALLCNVSTDYLLGMSDSMNTIG